MLYIQVEAKKSASVKMGAYKRRAEPVAQPATSSLKERLAGFVLEKRDRR